MKRILRKLFGLSLIAFGFGTFFVMDQATLVFNVSESMPENAYLMFERPSMVRRGAVTAFDMPPVLEDKFKDALYVKVVVGLPGDVIRKDEAGSPCINGKCFPLQVIEGGLFADAIPEGRIPPEHYAVFGTADDSLDSRYKMIGLMPAAAFRGTGFAIPLPHWETVAAWF